MFGRPNYAAADASFLANRIERSRLFAVGKLFNSRLAHFLVQLFIRTLRTFVQSFVRSLACRYRYLSLVGGVSARTARINYPRPKPHVVARGHSRESARRYTRVSRPYARVSVPSNLRVAAVHPVYARGIRESQYNRPQRIDERKKDVICRRRSRTRSRVRNTSRRYRGTIRGHRYL